MLNREIEVDPLSYRFDEWNNANRYAREAYEVLLDEQESPNRHDMDPPTVCLRRLHGLRTMSDVIRSAGGKWWCAACRADYQRRKAGRAAPVRQRRLSAEEDAQIRERYEAGESSQVLAPAFGVSDVTILKAVRRAGGRVRSLREATEARFTRAA